MVFNSIFVIQGGIEDIRKNLKMGADRKLRGQQKRMVTPGNATPTSRANPPLQSWFAVLHTRLPGYTGAVWSENIHAA